MNYLKALALILLVASSLNLVAQPKQFTKEAILSDLEYLKNELEANHPNLYTYSTKEEVNQWFEKQAQQMPLAVDDKEAFRIVSSISSLIKDGHSYIYLSAKHLADFFNTAPLFPLDLFLVKEELIVVNNFSREQNIPLGAKLVEINGVAISKIQSTIIAHTCRDGDNLGYPKHLYAQFFPAYHSMFYGFQEKFEISFLDKQGKIKKVSIAGLPRSEIKKQRSAEVKKGIELKLLPDGKSAVIVIKSFDNQTLKKDYQQKFKKEIQGIFQTLKEKGIQHLAIDLRDNQGGALSNGVYLLQHFMTNSFQCVNSYYVLKNGNRKRLNNKWDNHFEPKKKNHFDGQTYVFINEGSFSCSAIVANTFKENKRGFILGQMSGGSAFVNSGGPNKSITLPNTQISFTLPKTQYNLRENPAVIDQGVLPDVVIQDNPERLTGGLDNYIDKFIEFTQKK